MAQAKVTIDGTEYDVPVMKFKQLKAAYPLIAETRDSDNPIDIATKAIGVLSLAMMRVHPEMTPEWLEDKMSVTETKVLGDILLGIMKDSGLIDEDAADAVGKQLGAAPSTETSTLSSPNSSQPDAVAEIGTL